MRTKAILLLLLAALAASAAFLLLRNRETEAPVARITRDGVLLEEIDLGKVARPYTLVFEDESGTNTVQVERGRVRVSEADCPDRICVNQGWIADGAVPIVCLPHKLMIEIVNGRGDPDVRAG